MYKLNKKSRLISNFFPEIQDHPCPISRTMCHPNMLLGHKTQRKVPVWMVLQFFVKNPEPSIMQKEKHMRPEIRHHPQGPVSQIGILGYGSFFLGYWDITSFKLGYSKPNLGYWDIALMSISGEPYKIWDLGPTKLGYWDMGPLKFGYLGYRDLPLHTPTVRYQVGLFLLQPAGYMDCLQ